MRRAAPPARPSWRGTRAAYSRSARSGYCSATVRLLRVLVFGCCQAAVGAYVTTHTRWRTRARTRAGMRVRTRAQACRHALRGSQVGEAVWSGSEDNAVRIWDKSAAPALAPTRRLPPRAHARVPSDRRRYSGGHCMVPRVAERAARNRLSRALTAVAQVRADIEAAQRMGQRHCSRRPAGSLRAAQNGQEGEG